VSSATVSIVSPIRWSSRKTVSVVSVIKRTHLRMLREHKNPKPNARREAVDPESGGLNSIQRFWATHSKPAGEDFVLGHLFRAPEKPPQFDPNLDRQSTKGPARRNAPRLSARALRVRLQLHPAG